MHNENPSKSQGICLLRQVALGHFIIFHMRARMEINKSTQRNLAHVSQTALVGTVRKRRRTTLRPTRYLASIRLGAEVASSRVSGRTVAPPSRLPLWHSLAIRHAHRMGPPPKNLSSEGRGNSRKWTQSFFLRPVRTFKGVIT